MPWLFFLLAAGCIAIAMRTQSIGLALLCLLAALGLFLAGALGLASARIQSRSQPAGNMLSGDALAMARQRKAAQAPAAVPASGAAGKPDRDPDPAGDSSGGGGD